MLIFINKLSDLSLIQSNSLRIQFKIMLHNLLNSLNLSLNKQLVRSGVRARWNKVPRSKLMKQFSDGLWLALDVGEVFEEVFGVAALKEGLLELLVDVGYLLLVFCHVFEEFLFVSLE